MKKYKVIINRKECLGCGSCVSIMSRLLSLDPTDNLVNFKNSSLFENALVGEINEEDLADFSLAADACPLGIIKIEK
ncbi:MAG: ferredoxin [Patescibacteria group bacterium]